MTNNVSDRRRGLRAKPQAPPGVGVRSQASRAVEEASDRGSSVLRCPRLPGVSFVPLTTCVRSSR